MVDFNKLADSLIQFYQSDGEIQSREVGVLEELYNLDYFWNGTEQMTQLAAAINSGGVVDASDDLSLFSPDDQKTLRDVIGEKPFVARAAMIMRRLQTASTHAEADQIVAQWFDLTMNRGLPMWDSFGEDIGDGLKHYLEFPDHDAGHVEWAMGMLQFYNNARLAEVSAMYVPQVTTPAEFKEKVWGSSLPVVLLDTQEVSHLMAIQVAMAYFGKVRFVAIDRAAFPWDSEIKRETYFSTLPQLKKLEGESEPGIVSIEMVFIKPGNHVVGRLLDKNLYDETSPSLDPVSALSKYFGIEPPFTPMAPSTECP